MRTLVVGLVVVGCLALAGWFVFVPRPPSPTGSNAIGRAELVFQDSLGRPIPVTVWYPTAGGNGGEPAMNAPLDARSPAPLVLYSPGWGTTRTQSRSQMENLASHGFVVVGCDDLASEPTADPDQRANLDVSSDAATAATIERAGRHVVRQAGRLLAVLDALEAGQSSLLAGRLDLARVGVLGYSIGGGSGLAAALMDARIVAVFNLDGGIFGPPTTRIGSEAYFLLSSREAFPSESELTSPDASIRNYALVSALDLPRNKRRMERPDNYWAQLPQAEHADLSDDLFVFSVTNLHRTNFERSNMTTAIQTFEVAFFRKVLLGEQDSLLGVVGQSDQTVRWISPTSESAGATRARQ